MNQVQITLPDKMMVMTAPGEHEIKIYEGNLSVYDHSRTDKGNGVVAAYPKGEWCGALVLDRNSESD